MIRPGTRDDLFRISGRRLAVTGATAFVLFIIALFPARLVWQWQQYRVPSLHLAAIEGTVWNGTATGVVLGGVPLGTGTVSWRPLALLQGEWRNRVRVAAPLGEAEGSVGWTLAGAKVASDVSLRTSLSAVLRYLPRSANTLPVRIDGDVDLVINNLVVRDGNVDRLDGALQLGDFTVSANPVGSLVAELHDHEGGLVADFHSEGDPSPEIEGTAFWLPSGDYRLSVALADPDLFGKEAGGLIKGFATKDNGKWRIEWQGRF